LVRLRAVLLRQKDLFAPITVGKTKRFEEVVAEISAAQVLADFGESLS
jgi:hypothetical protein